MKVVRNNVVEMDWDADGFVESKKEGFISAVHRFDGVAVAFRDGKVYTHIDEDGGAISFKDLVSSIKSAAKEKDSDYPYFYEDYAELFDGQEFNEETLVHLGIEDHKDEMLKRLEDLSGYWIITESTSL